jgi:hypothetical protein
MTRNNTNIIIFTLNNTKMTTKKHEKCIISHETTRKRKQIGHETTRKWIINTKQHESFSCVFVYLDFFSCGLV